MKPNETRPADTLIEESAKKLTKRLSLIANKKIKFWKALLIIVFVAGFATSLAWSISTDTMSKSQAASTKIKCSDSDGGKIIELEGVCQDNKGKTADYCVDNKLKPVLEGQKIREYYCDSKKDKCAVTTTKCPKEKTCKDGACVAIVSNLKSNFFKDDPIANSIINGKNYQLKEENFFTKDMKRTTLSFEYKLLSAFRQMGYNNLYYFYYRGQDGRFMISGLAPLSIFQKRHSLSIANPNIIDKNILKLIDSDLAEKEKSDKTLAEKYPPYGKFIDAPTNEPSKKHLVSLLSNFFLAMPDEIYEKIWTIDEFRQSLVIGLGGNLGMMMNSEGTRVLSLDEAVEVMNSNGDFKVCPNSYYQKFSELQGGDCINPSAAVVSEPPSDFDYMLTIIHEYGHGNQGEEIIKNGAVTNLSNLFGAISFDISDETWLRPENNYGEFVSGYARTGPIPIPYHNYSIHHEDFAESFSAYINEGKIFREKAQSNIYLRQKYDFLKSYVFHGIEYNTGSLESFELWNENHSQNELPFSVGMYEENDPNWVWDYKYPFITAKSQ